MAMDPAMIDHLARMREPNGETCQYCDGQVLGASSGVTVCRECYYRGMPMEATHGELLTMIRAMDLVSRAGFTHTGGGCWGLEIEITTGRYVFMTEAWQDDDGGWETDATIPDDAPGSWCITAHVSPEAFHECSGDGSDEPAVRYATGLNVVRWSILGALMQLEGQTNG